MGGSVNGAANSVSERDPLTDRGRRRRAEVVDAARRTFEGKGFAETRMSDIADAAGVAHGTVYTYFDSKEAVLRAVIADLVADVREALRVGDEDADPVARIRVANQRYLSAYAEYARLLQVVQEVASADPKFAEVLDDLRSRYVARAVSGIQRLQAEGLVDDSLDAEVSGGALCAMVEGYAAHDFLAEAGQPVSSDHVERVAAELTRLWAQALGLQATAGRAPRRPAERRGTAPSRNRSQPSSQAQAQDRTTAPAKGRQHAAVD